ncbi:SDR family oxidoreductase [Glycomyces xiaoerkulensis]|uniref:SDR family oxidoreductase n=1 Tax=Glycomyces xiaoerkulensis TaxID=2038139 RepID=UPI000C2589B7|nr:SDR family oxidoreductase [Glycomyces xiaoerkulensis]
MSNLKVLFIGGSGAISTSCVHEAVGQGMDVTVLNRGESRIRRLPDGITRLRADANDPDSVLEAIGEARFDAVVNWVNFVPEQVRRDIDLYADRTDQYLFISSASAYQTPPTRMPVTESTPLKNPHWQYSRDKIACEELLVEAYRDRDFPMTIVRPSHTYDQTLLPCEGGWTAVERMRAGRPVVVHGDGTSLWTLTHARDFAVGFVGLLGKEAAIGEAFHITGDEAPTWDRIFRDLAAAAGVGDPELVHVPTDAIAASDPDWGAGLIGDKSHTMLFDNSKLKSLVPEFGLRPTPFRLGAREIVDWYDAHPEQRTVDPELDALMDRLIEAHRPRAL